MGTRFAHDPAILGNFEWILGTSGDLRVNPCRTSAIRQFSAPFHSEKLAYAVSLLLRIGRVANVLSCSFRIYSLSGHEPRALCRCNRLPPPMFRFDSARMDDLTRSAVDIRCIGLSRRHRVGSASEANPDDFCADPHRRERPMWLIDAPANGSTDQVRDLMVHTPLIIDSEFAPPVVDECLHLQSSLSSSSRCGESAQGGHSVSRTPHIEEHVAQSPKLMVPVYLARICEFCEKLGSQRAINMDMTAWLDTQGRGK